MNTIEGAKPHWHKCPTNDGLQQRKGTIIVLVLVMIAVLSLAALTFSELMLAERRGADYAVRRTQARLLAESGIEAVRMALLLDEEEMTEFGEMYNNPDQLCGALVTDSQEDVRDVGRFSVISPLLNEEGLFADDVRYGLADESSKINLRMILVYEEQEEGAGREILMGLPGVDETIADAILDWLDEDDEQREYGYEYDYYESLEPPYTPRNGMIESIEELLLVEGVTPNLLFGADWNRNGLMDLGEPDSTTIDEYDNAEGLLNCGLAAYLTVDCKEKDISDKINVNSDDLEQLQTDLNSKLSNQEWVTYILAYRLYGTTVKITDSETASTSTNSTSESSPNTNTNTNTSDNGGDSSADQTSTENGDETAGETDTTNQLDLSGTPKAKINSPFDLIGGSLQVQYSGQTTTTTLNSPFSEETTSMAEYLPTLINSLKFSDDDLAGRVNLNEAPKGVLLALPGITEDAVDAIIANRLPDPVESAEVEEMATYAWPLLLEYVDLDTMKKIAPFLSSGGVIKSAQVVARFDSHSPVVRMKVLFDTSEQPAKIVCVTDLTDLGPGFPANMLGVNTDTQSLFSSGNAVTGNSTSR